MQWRVLQHPAHQAVQRENQFVHPLLQNILSGLPATRPRSFLRYVPVFLSLLDVTDGLTRETLQPTVEEMPTGAHKSRHRNMGVVRANVAFDSRLSLSTFASIATRL